MEIWGFLIVVFADSFSGGEEMEGEEGLRQEFLCPFCGEDFDMVGLCCHIDEEHMVEVKNGVCICFFLFYEFSS